MLYFILLTIIILVVAAVLLTVTLAAGIGVGWILMQIAPFTLFEGSMLGLIGVVAAGYVTFRFFRSINQAEIAPWDDEDDDDMEYLFEDAIEDGTVAIPPDRFLSDKSPPTWTDWYRFIFANDIYDEFQAHPASIRHMNDMQQRELSIRLAETAIDVLRAKPRSTRRLKITREQVERKMRQGGQKPYDDDIMEIVSEAIDDLIVMYDDGILEIIRNRKWDSSTPMFEM